MKYTIEALDDPQEGMSWNDIGVQYTLGQAYLWSKEAGDELPNFADVIWDNDVDAIINNCRELGIKEFTISSTFSNLIITIAKFEDLGCKLDGIVKIKDRYHFRNEEQKLIPAFKMTVK